MGSLHARGVRGRGGRGQRGRVVGDDRRRDEVAVGVLRHRVAAAVEQQRRALVHRGLDQALDARLGRRAHHRPEVRARDHPEVGLELLGLRHQVVAPVARLAHQHARGERHAALPRRAAALWAARAGRQVLSATKPLSRARL